MTCLLCEQDSESLKDPGATCPHCGALPADRQLAFFFRAHMNTRLAEGTKVLDIGPSAMQATNLAKAQNLGAARYTAVDSRTAITLDPPHRFMFMDVTRLTFSDSSFDVILCNNVLPFVRSDYQAMSQIHRCLKSTGLAIMNVSIDRRKTTRADDHGPVEWFYGEDYFERLASAGFFHHRLPLKNLGSSSTGEMILCFKFRDAMEEFLGAL